MIIMIFYKNYIDKYLKEKKEYISSNKLNKRDKIYYYRNKYSK
jgi:hypothetical protein